MKTSTDSKNDLKSNSVDLKFMNFEKYCNYSKMLRVAAYVLRFINNLKGRSKRQILFYQHLLLNTNAI